MYTVNLNANWTSHCHSYTEKTSGIQTFVMYVQVKSYTHIFKFKALNCVYISQNLYTNTENLSATSTTALAS